MQISFCCVNDAANSKFIDTNALHTSGWQTEYEQNGRGSEAIELSLSEERT